MLIKMGYLKAIHPHCLTLLLLSHTMTCICLGEIPINHVYISFSFRAILVYYSKSSNSFIANSICQSSVSTRANTYRV